jgi:TRAP-type transport system large permease protein
MTALIIGLFIVAALASIPIAHALVLASVGALLAIGRIPVDLAVQQMISQMQSFPLIAIPFFMLTGALMVSGKLGQSLVSLLSMMIGRIHGGPAQVGVMSSTIFGGVRRRLGVRCR